MVWKDVYVLHVGHKGSWNSRPTGEIVQEKKVAEEWVAQGGNRDPRFYVVMTLVPKMKKPKERKVPVRKEVMVL